MELLLHDQITLDIGDFCLFPEINMKTHHMLNLIDKNVVQKLIIILPEEGKRNIVGSVYHNFSKMLSILTF